MKDMNLRLAMQSARTEDLADHDPLRLRDAAAYLARHIEHQEDLLGAARDLHMPDDSLDCRGCGLTATEEPTHWPCATAKALGNPRAELAVRWDG